MPTPVVGVMSFNMDRARIRVDFNELVDKDLVLLSKTDEVMDSAGNSIFLVEGLEVFVYEYNHYKDGEKEYLLADGVAELNNPKINEQWSVAVKWCCRINKDGIKSKNS